MIEHRMILKEHGKSIGAICQTNIALHYDFLAKWENSMVKVPLPWVELRNTVE
jgi:hypothetical protein